MDSVLVVPDEKLDSLKKKISESEDVEFFYADDLTAAGKFLNTQSVKAVVLSEDKFLQILSASESNQQEIDSLKIENQKLHDKIEELKLVSRAKSVLMRYLNMSEQQAHKYIEKQSMDLRQSRTVTAEAILKTYEI